MKFLTMFLLVETENDPERFEIREGRGRELVSRILLINYCRIQTLTPLFSSQIMNWASKDVVARAEVVGLMLKVNLKSKDEGVEAYKLSVELDQKRDMHTIKTETNARVTMLSTSWVRTPSLAHIRHFLTNDFSFGSLLKACNILHAPESAARLTVSYSHQVSASSNTMQVAGRALSKHAQRSTDGWWGQAQGTESLKNFRAEKVILRILQNATWINIHSLPV